MSPPIMPPAPAAVRAEPIVARHPVHPGGALRCREGRQPGL